MNKRREGKGVIYKITNINNGKVYIGQTTTPLKYRYSGHLSNAKAGANTPLHKDMREQGFDSSQFPFEIIGIYDVEELDDAERNWIKTYKEKGCSIYNLQSGGWKGRQQSEITKADISRGLGTLDNIVVYNWVKGELIGEFTTGKRAMESVGLTGLQNMIKNLSKSYIVAKEYILLYKFKEGRAEEIIKDVRREYPSYLNNTVIKDESRIGEGNPFAKLDEKTVTAIISDLIKGDKNKDIANRYGISRQSVTDINYRRTWSHIVIEGYEDVGIYKMSRRKKSKMTASQQ